MPGKKLDMTADVNIKDDDKNYFPVHTQSPLSKSSVKYATKTRMLGFYVKTVCVIIATSSVSRITRKTSHVLAVWDLVMKNILADKIHQVWTSEMRHKLKKIRKASITLE